jgi:hypothetical protein
MKKNKLLPYYYGYEKVYVNFSNSIKENDIIELSNYKKLNRVEQFNIILNLIEKINKILKYPKFFIDIIKLNKNKIIRLINLREKIKNITNKTVYL